MSKSEQNYWPTEGEAFAVAWVLYAIKFFTLGYTDLNVQTDHKHLVKLLGNKTLDEIDNKRLADLKEKTFLLNLKIYWVPGKEIPSPDATSRQPQDSTEPDESPALAGYGRRVVILQTRQSWLR